MAFKKLTEKGKEFIRHYCVDVTPEGDLFSGTNGVLPFSDPLVNKTWTANVEISSKFFNFKDISDDVYNFVKRPSSLSIIGIVDTSKYLINTTTDEKTKIITNSELANAIMGIINYYSIIYELDANIIAAQLYTESAYKLWVYPKDGDFTSDASGISQFTMETIYGVGISNRIKGIEPFTNDEKNKLKLNLKFPDDPNSYSPRESNNKTAKENRAILHQNFINNVDLMIKIQCRYMAHIATFTKSLASSTLLGYSRGPSYALNTYSKSVDKLISKKGTYDNSRYTKEGLDYVLKIFKLLGDPSRKYSFGYNQKEYTSVDGDKRIFNLNSEFDAYETTVSESDEYGILAENVEAYQKNGETVPLAVIEQNVFPYRTVKYPENQYYSGSKNKQNNKNQLILHHTVSGPLVNGDLYSWQSKGDKVSTAFLISRKGEIYQVFNSHFWGVHIFRNNDPFELAKQQFGLDFESISQQRETLEKKSIGIELDSWGGLKQNAQGQWVNAYDEVLDPTKYQFQLYPNGYRGYFAFEKYTTEQINATKALILALQDRWGFPLNYNENMWDFNGDAINRKPGIWSHVSYRPDKSDCHPQPELINMLKSLNG